jgi:hypothetical protein
MSQELIWPRVSGQARPPAAFSHGFSPVHVATSIFSCDSYIETIWLSAITRWNYRRSFTQQHTLPKQSLGEKHALLLKRHSSSTHSAFACSSTHILDYVFHILH